MLSNTVIARNVAGDKGGGVHVDSGTGPNLVNNTVISNSMEGIYIDAYAQARITNTIVVSNGLGIRALNPSNPLADYNLVWGNTLAGDYDGLAAGAHDIQSDPLFVAAAANDYHLTAASPAIDSGLTSVAPGSDRDGNVRPLVGRCTGQQVADIGAYEFLLPPGACTTPSPTVTPASPTATGTATATTTATATATRTQTPTATLTPVSTGTATRTQTPTTTATRTATVTATRTNTVTVSPTATKTASRTSTATATGTRTRTATPTNTATSTETPTPTMTATETPVVFHLYLPIISSNLLPDCAAYEPNDSMNVAWGPLVMSMQYHAYLCFSDPVDWYYFDAPRAGAVSVDLLVPAQEDLNVSLHAADGTLIAESNRFGEGVDEHIITVVQTAGRYYVRVLPFTRRDPNQPYDLTVNFF